MKIVIITLSVQEHGLCSGKYSGTAKLLSGIDGGLVEEDALFETTCGAYLPFSTDTYTVSMAFGLLGRKLLSIRKDGKPIPLHQVVITNGPNTVMLFDEHS